jgi:predicted dehydrogenase
MKFLVIGLGSMGKRRVRNLQALGHADIAGFDPREDRRQEAASKYGIRTFDHVEQALAEFQPEALVVSTSPKYHMEYALLAESKHLHCFIEASVLEAEGILALAKRIDGKGLAIVPSCTMRYFPGPRKVKELVASGIIGKPLNFNYQTGQWLPDWHPWEHIRDFYVSDPLTGACREIVPFELTWLNDIFGDPTALACVRSKVSDMDADIDDVYHCLLRYPGNVLGNVTIEVLSRPIACRELRVIGSAGELVFSADTKSIRYATTEHPQWTYVALDAGRAEANYINPEEPYIDEMRAFVDAAQHGDRTRFPNRLEDDYRILQTLYLLEALAESLQKTSAKSIA